MLEDGATAFRVGDYLNRLTQGSSFVATTGLICETPFGVFGNEHQNESRHSRGLGRTLTAEGAEGLSANSANWR